MPSLTWVGVAPTRTRSLSTVNDRVHPIRSAITVAGISGHCCNNARICGSTASTIDGFAGREYRGGPSGANARRTVFRPTPNLRASALIGIPSDRCRRGISAQSSTLNTLPILEGGPDSPAP
ncbi:hypothetical protein GCM10027452_05070 [Micromonospora halotolerans]